ncbi:MAG: tRNA (adenosine(37)-N6)-dimethylallyltransferase MiaA [Victivallaceae bacterium]
MSDQPEIIVIAGPTASGKSELALRIAQDFNGEIISADSMQLYRGLDIGTAKPSAEELFKVKHHLLNLFDIDQKLDVYIFLKLAEAAIIDIRRRGKLPIVAGGTGFYIRSLLYGLNELPGDPVLRAGLDRQYDHDAGFEKLKELMQKLDSADYERWHKHRRKLIRALEVFKLTGKSITELQTLNTPRMRYRATVWSLAWERDELKRRIATRTAAMLEAGWIAEAAEAISQGILNTPTARQVLGYSIINEYLDGKISYERMQEEIITSTWQLARRQLTWFRNQHPEAETIAMPTDYSVLAAKLKNGATHRQAECFLGQLKK